MITSFCIEWHNWGEIHAIDDIAIEITKVSRRKKLLTIGQCNAIGNDLLSTAIPLTNETCDHLFALVKAVADEASQQNYMIEVNDGYHWRLLLRHSDKHVRILEGTVAAPNAAKELENYIENLLENQHNMDDVHLFGARW